MIPGMISGVFRPLPRFGLREAFEGRDGKAGDSGGSLSGTSGASPPRGLHLEVRTGPAAELLAALLPPAARLHALRRPCTTVADTQPRLHGPRAVSHSAHTGSGHNHDGTALPRAVTAALGFAEGPCTSELPCSLQAQARAITARALARGDSGRDGVAPEVQLWRAAAAKVSWGHAVCRDGRI